MLQVIVPIFNEPLLCELWLRNYVKYKQKYVDRLILLVTTKFVDYDDVVTGDVDRLKQQLDQLNVCNYKIVCVGSGNMHGLIFNEVLSEIYDSNYHTLIDEQDAYWLNDNFQYFVKLLETYDVIGGEKMQYPIQFDTTKFNTKYKRNHPKQLQYLHLPQFLSNRIVAKIKDFRAECREIAADKCNIEDITTATTMLFDTFQYINLQIYRHTDNILLFPDGEKSHPSLQEINDNHAWNITNTVLYQHLRTFPNTTYTENVLFHTGGTVHFCRAKLFDSQSPEQLKQNYVDALYLYLNERAILNMNFYSQSLQYLPNFFNKSNYATNFDKIKHVVNLSKYDCTTMIQKILCCN